MSPTLISVSIALVVLGVLFGALERAFPAVRGRPLLRAGARTDVLFWLFTPLVTKALTRAAVIVAAVLVAAALGARLDRESLQRFLSERRTLIGAQPLWLQAIEAFVLGDLISYATHRLFHRSRRLWPIHAVHHSSTELDWLSSVRVHPLNDIVPRVVQAVAIVGLGFPPSILAAYVPLLTLYALLLHANVPWTFGPLRYVIASPAFHRWHHTTEGMGKNLAGFFPAIDLAFGTFWMPEGRTPEKFGIPSSDVPEGFLGQLVYPFRRRERRRPSVETRPDAPPGRIEPPLEVEARLDVPAS